MFKTDLFNALLLPRELRENGRYFGYAREQYNQPYISMEYHSRVDILIINEETKYKTHHKESLIIP